MIHVFQYRNKNYIYDVGSGSLHECDQPTADYLKAKEQTNGNNYYTAQQAQNR